MIGTKKQGKVAIATMIVIVFLISSLLPFLLPTPSNDVQRAYVFASVTAISPSGSTTVYMTAGTANHTMINVTADGYVTQAFPAQTNTTNIFLSYVNFTIIVSSERYYEFQLWTGDLGSETNASRLMMKIGDKVIGNKIFNSTASGNATSFAGNDQRIIMGEVRILPGTYDVKMVNMINESSSATYQESETYIGFTVTPTSRLVHAIDYSFVYVADTHYVSYVSGNPTVIGNLEMLKNSVEINEAWVAQVNDMIPAPSFVVINGDLLTVSGIDTIDTVAFRSLLDTLTMPYYLLLGNHDKGTVPVNIHQSIYENFTDLFPEWTPSVFYYYRDIDGTRFVFLDTNDGGDGIIGGTQQSWLNSTLNTGLPVFISQHYPLLTGSWDILTNAAEITAIIGQHDNVIADFAGHGHNEWIKEQSGTLFVENPSIIQYPLFYTTVDWHKGTDYYTGNAIDVNRVQLNFPNASAILHHSNRLSNTSVSIGDTIYVQYLGDLAFIGGPVILNIVQLTFLIVTIGIIVGIIGEATYALHRQKTAMRRDALRSLFNMVIYIIIGMAGLGILYNMVS